MSLPLTPPRRGRRIVCVDVGSTFTKAVMVDVDAPAGEPVVLGSESHATTLPTLHAGADVLDGLDAVTHRLEQAHGPAEQVLACSSAGGGLRIAVVGYERQVTAEAGYRVSLSAGGKVVHTHAGELDGEGLRSLRGSRPDIVLLVGGTDGGNSEVLRHNATRLAKARVAVPVVVAGNRDAAPEVAETLRATGRRVVVADNVLPSIGSLAPASARAAIREAFLEHVIGGKRLSRGPRFAKLVRGATPDVVLAGVEVLADGAPGVPGLGDVLVVDVGGATTDVYSVLTPEGEDATLRKEVVAPLWRARTVEGDLGVRWGAVGVVEAAVAEGLLDGADEARLRAAAERRVADTEMVPAAPEEVDDDLALARLAVTVALRRHARPTGPSSDGRDLREVSAVVGSGGVLRHASPPDALAALAPATTDHAGGWRVPVQPAVVVDRRYLLFAAGLLADEHPVAAARVAHQVLDAG
ncbi:MAG TPA: glutamate mutase L [Actinomycetales bacterium]|nr:glutamate mutase L [Actinomycetales bacterium]